MPRQPDDQDLHQLILDYLAGCSTNHPQFHDAVQRITAMTFISPPELQWKVILEAIHLASDDNDLGHIAAGPIEGFLGRHGFEWIDRVEAEVRRNLPFARAITGVWKHTMKDAVGQRIKVIRSAVPTHDWLPAGLRTAL